MRKHSEQCDWLRQMRPIHGLRQFRIIQRWARAKNVTHFVVFKPHPPKKILFAPYPQTRYDIYTVTLLRHWAGL